MGISRAGYSSVSRWSVIDEFDAEEKAAGEKFNEADLIGCPIRLVISDKTLVEGAVEYKRRNETAAELIKLEKLISKIADVK